MSVSYYPPTREKLKPRKINPLSNTPDLNQKKPPRPIFSQNDIMKTPFLFIQAHKDDYYNMAQEAMRGVQEETILSKVFFSTQNVARIQKQIIKTVLIVTDKQFLIEEQDEADLMVVLRSMFLQHARHYSDDIPGQIKELNDLVVDEVVPGIISEIKAYVGYLERVFEPLYFQDRPQNVGIHGLRTLPSVTRTFG
jgi:hypothetical protein